MGVAFSVPQTNGVQALFRIHRYMYAHHVFDAESVGGGAGVGGEDVAVVISSHSHLGNQS